MEFFIQINTFSLFNNMLNPFDCFVDEMRAEFAQQDEDERCKASQLLSNEIEIYKELYERRKIECGEFDPATLKLQIIISETYLDGGAVEDALKMSKSLYKELIRLLKQDDIDHDLFVNYLIAVCNNIGKAFLFLGRPEEALDSFKEALSRQQDLTGSNHPDTIIPSFYISQTLVIQNKYDDAFSLLQGIHQSLHHFSEKNPFNLVVGLELNRILIMKKCNFRHFKHHNKKKTNMQLDESGIGINILPTRKKVFQFSNDLENSINFWKFACSNTGLIKQYSFLPMKIIRSYLVLGKYNEAVSFGKEATSLLKQFKGLKHPDTIMTQLIYATALCFQGHYKYALKVLYKIKKNNHVLLDCEKDIIQNQIAIALSEAGEYQKAVNIFSDISRKMKRLGTKNPINLTVDCHFADALQNLGEYEKAASLINELEKEDEFKMNPHLHYYRALLLADQNKHEEALFTFNFLLEESIISLGYFNLNTLTYMYQVGRMLHLLRRHTQALSILRCVQDFREKILGPSNIYTLRTLILIAQILLEQYKYQDALDICLSTLPKITSILGPTHKEVLEAEAIIDKLRRKVQIINCDLPILLHCVAEGNLSRVIYLIQNGVKINETDSNKDTSLHYAARCDNLEIIKFLLENGAMYNSKNDKGIIPSQLVTKPGVKDLFVSLHKFFSNVKSGSYEELSKVLKKEKQLFVNVKEVGGYTPLHWAVHGNFENITKLLLELSSSPAAATDCGNTALHLAVDKGFRQIVKLLLQSASCGPIAFINLPTTAGGNTAMHVASRNGFCDLVKTLMAHGAVYNKKNNEQKSPLELSTDEDVISLLKKVDKYFQSAREGDVTLTRKLKSLDAETFAAVIHTCNTDGNTLFQAAIINKQNKVAAKLFELLPIQK